MKQLDLRNTVFYEPTGLDQCNISTATDLVENSGGERLTCVVLGVPRDNLRFRETRRLVEWGFGQVGTAQKAGAKD